MKFRIIIAAIIITCLEFTKCFQISVYIFPDFEGDEYNLTVTTPDRDYLPYLPYQVTGYFHIASINTYGHCVILYLERPRSYSTAIIKLTGPKISDLSRYLHGDEKVGYIGPCQDCIMRDGVENWPDIEEYTFRLGNGTEMQTGIRWIFNSSEFKTQNKSNACGIIPPTFLTHPNLAVKIYIGCVQFYSSQDCSASQGESIQLLRRGTPGEFKQFGFHKLPRSFSHCNSKCSPNKTFITAKGESIPEDKPQYVGVRVLISNGNRYDISADRLSNNTCYGFKSAGSHGLQITTKGICIVLYQDENCIGDGMTNPPLVLNAISRDDVITFDTARDSEIGSIRTCKEAMKSEAYPTILGNRTFSSDTLEIAVFNQTQFEGENKTTLVIGCRNVMIPITPNVSVETRGHCIALYSDLNCTGQREILFPGSPVLRDMKLLIGLDEIKSVEKCRIADTLAPKTNEMQSFKVSTERYDLHWTFNYVSVRNHELNTCWEISYFFRVGGVASVTVNKGCIQLFMGTTCNPYADSVRVRPSFNSTNLYQWGSDTDYTSKRTFASFSACNVRHTEFAVFKPNTFPGKPHPRYQPDGVAMLFSSGNIQHIQYTRSCENLENGIDIYGNKTGLVQLTVQDSCFYIFNMEKCTMFPTNEIPYLLNFTGKGNVVEYPDWNNAAYSPRSIINCDVYDSAQNFFKSNLNHNDSKVIENYASSTLNTALIYIGIVIVCTMCVVVVIVVLQRRHAAKNKLSGEEIDFFYNGSTSPSADSDDAIQKRAVNREYEIQQKEFTYVNSEDNNPVVLGSGAFGVVIKGVLHTGFDEETCAPRTKDVAIKSPRIGITVEQIRALLSEIKINMFVGRHKHIVEFVGFCIEEVQRGKVSIILELCENGSLLNFVRSHSKEFMESFQQSEPSQNVGYSNVTSYNARQLVLWCKEISEGMQFLAESKVLHGDLAARNCLLDKHLCVKITDFGLSRKLYDYGNYVKKGKAMLPWRWMALESLKSFQFSVKSDVWSFGITMWEMFSFGSQPYPTLTWNDYFIDSLSAGLRLQKPEFCPDACFTWMQRCWLPVPEDRTDFAEFSALMAVYLR